MDFRAKPAEPAAPASRTAPSAGRKRDAVTSLFSARRPARRVVQGDKATKPRDQRLKWVLKPRVSRDLACAAGPRQKTGKEREKGGGGKRAPRARCARRSSLVLANGVRRPGPRRPLSPRFLDATRCTRMGYISGHYLRVSRFYFAARTSPGRRDECPIRDLDGRRDVASVVLRNRWILAWHTFSRDPLLIGAVISVSPCSEKNFPRFFPSFLSCILMTQVF